MRRPSLTGPIPLRLVRSAVAALLKTQSLLDGLAHDGFDAAFGGLAATKRNHGLRNGSTLFAICAGNGTRRISGPNSGIFLTPASIRARPFACFRFPTGPRSTSGSTSIVENIPIVPLYFAKHAPMVVRGEFAAADRAAVSCPLPGEEPRDGEVPHAFAGLQSMHGRHPLRCRHRSEDHCEELVGFAPFGARKSGD